MRRKEERSKQGQTNNKAKQHSTPMAVTLQKKNELPRVGHEPTTLYTLDRVHLMNRLTINSLRMKEKAGVMKPPKTPNTKHVHVCLFDLACFFLSFFSSLMYQFANDHSAADVL